VRRNTRASRVAACGIVVLATGEDSIPVRWRSAMEPVTAV
jgi:hypothetical protein